MTDRFMLKVRLRGESRYKFVDGLGGLVSLRVHAIAVPRKRADELAMRLRANERVLDVKVVEA